MIIMNGFCETPPPRPKTAAVASRAKSTAACQTVITRAQFDELADAIRPDMDAGAKRQLATFYPKLLLMQREFSKRDLGKDPRVRRALAFTKLRSEAEEMAKKLKEEAGNLPQAEIEEYYKDHASAYQTSELERIYVPKQKRQADGKESRAESDHDAMNQEAHALQARAAAGENFIKLQNDAYEAAGIVGTRPPVYMGKLTASDLPPGQRSAMSVKPGEVSDLIEDSSGYYIFKVMSTGAKSLAQAQSEIKASLAQQKFTVVMQKIEQSAKIELNEAYFPTSSPGAPAAKSLGTRPGGR
ncbi:MAG: peptidyl-prolyl cis-trans isomerase [Acidobacteriia bacterium]|nr:peptidyl-prolyl cis-trans isomerase [Terriglobia bacterium]